MSHLQDASAAWHQLKGIEPVSLCDWPGKVSCVLFFGGCNFRCPTCHNYMLARHGERLPSLDRDEVLFFLRGRKKWLDGVVLSGGEPCEAKGLDEIIFVLREMGFKVKLDTNGSHPEVVESLVERSLIDAVAVDVKGPYSLYPQLTGGTITPEEIQRKLTQIFSIAKRYPSMFYFRCTRVPLLSEEHLRETRSYLPEGFELSIQEYIEPKPFFEENK